MANKETLDTDKKKNSASAIVKYHNELNQVNFGSFSPVELDIFFAIISKMRDKKTDEVKMPLRELREMINYPVRGDKKISSDIARAYKKFFDLSYYNHDEKKKEISFFHLFDKFTINYEDSTLSLRIAEDGQKFLNYLGLASGYTVYELSEFCSLRGAYAKNLYRMLRQYRTTGFFIIQIDEFRAALDVPTGYRTADLIRRVIDPAVSEVSDVIKDISYEFVRAGGRGRKIEKVIFRFKPQGKNEIYENSKARGKRSGHICPYCGEMLYEKVINGNNCWCHPDGYQESAKCKIIFNGIDEILYGKNGELKAKEEENQNQTPEIEEMRKKITQMFTGF